MGTILPSISAVLQRLITTSGDALCVLDYTGSRLMDGGHHLSSGVERSFADSGARLDEVILAHAQGIGVSDESGLGGLARSLNCGKLTDKSLPLAHRGNAYGKDYRDDCRQSLGYGRERRKRLKKDLQQYYLPKVLRQTPEGRLSAASRSEIVGKQIG